MAAVSTPERSKKPVTKKLEKSPMSPQKHDRLSVTLLPKVVGQLDRLQDRTGLSKTDVINRAISIYDFIDEQTREGRTLLLRNSDGTTQYVQFL
jgi:Ribbon-helix-helix protein, copG family